MLKKGSNNNQGTYLARTKLRKMVFISSLEAVVMIIMVATDRILLGHFIGTDAVSAAVLIEPFLMLCNVFQVLVSKGASILYTRCVGNYENEKSKKILGTGAALAFIFGIIMLIITFLGNEAFFEMNSIHGEVRVYAKQYLSFWGFAFLIMPLLNFLSEILYVDGDETKVLFSNLAFIIGNLICSFFLIPQFGVYGASIGSLIGCVLAVGIVLTHFIPKKYRFVPTLKFDRSDVIEIFKIGSTETVDEVLDLLFVFLLNLFVIRMFGVEYLALMTIVEIVYGLMAFGLGISETLPVLLLSYRSDKNYDALKAIMRYIIRIIIVLSIIYVCAIWIIAPYLPAAVSITDPAMQTLGTNISRLTALSVFGVILYEFLLEYYMNIGMYGLQIFGHVLDSLLIPVFLLLLFGLSLGPMGLGISYLLNNYICFVILLLVVYKKYGKDGFPLIMEKTIEKSMNISYTSDIDSIVGARDKVEKFLREQKVPKSTIYLTMMFIEDLSVLIKDSNDKDDLIHFDVFLICDPQSLSLVLWNDGKEIDMSDEDQVPSDLRAYLVSSLLSRFEDKKYQLTADYNRTRFVIPYRYAAKI